MTQFDETILDHNALQELREDLEDAFQGFVQTFIRGAREGLALMAAALDSNDLVEVARQAHALQGTVGYLGARRLSAQLQALQESAQGGNARSLAGILAAETEDFSDLEKQIVEFMS